MTPGGKSILRIYNTQILEININEFLEWLKRVDLILKDGTVSESEENDWMQKKDNGIWQQQSKT